MVYEWLSFSQFTQASLVFRLWVSLQYLNFKQVKVFESLM